MNLQPIKKVAKKPLKPIKDAAHTLPFVPPGKQKQYTWEELAAIEKRRRDILPRVEEPFWRILSYWDGTCLRVLVRDSLFWITCAIYVLIRMQARYGSVPVYVHELGNGNVALLGGFLTFFLVLYVNRSHARFFKLYDDTMACKGRIFDVATLATSYLPKATAHRLVRWMNAAHTTGFVGLSQTYPAGTFFVKINQDLGLLTDDELERMNEIDLDKGGACNRELIAWCMRDIYLAHRNGILDNELAQQFREQILQLRAKIGQLYNAADLPIPFFYVHFICLLTVMYLPLFAISAAYRAGTGADVYWTADVVAGLVVVLQAVFVIGLRILGQKMSDPFGDDLTDLSVIHYVKFTWTQSNRVLNTKFPEADADPQVEHLLSKNSMSIGKAWESVDEEE